MNKHTAEQVDLRNLIYADTQFGYRGETDLKLVELQSLVTRGWMQEGDENNEFDLTDAGRDIVAATLHQQDERGDGAVSDDKLMDAVQESLLEYRLRNWADESGDSLSLLDHLSAGETIQSGREEIEQMADAVCEAVAPLLRPSAEQGRTADAIAALRTIADWKLPDITVPWPNGVPVNYETCYGSNGARDYMRAVARTALANASAEPRYIEEIAEALGDPTLISLSQVATGIRDLKAERARVPDGLLQLIRDARHRICNDAPSGLSKRPFDDPVYGPLLRRLDAMDAQLASTAQPEDAA